MADSGDTGTWQVSAPTGSSCTGQRLLQRLWRLGSSYEHVSAVYEPRVIWGLISRITRRRARHSRAAAGAAEPHRWPDLADSLPA